MSNNINRYAYTDFTQKPYIHYHGIPFQKNNCGINNNDQNRTIIRTLQNSPASQYVIPAPANQQFISQAPVTQSYQLSAPVPKKQQPAAPINNNVPVPINSTHPYNQTNNAGNIAPNTFSDAWSNFVRKDKIFERYSCDCDK